MCPFGNQMNVRNLDGTDLAPSGTMCLKWLDTEQEKAINVGVSWPYEKLEPYDCIVSSTFATLGGVSVGDQIEVNVAWTYMWLNLRN